MIQSSASKNNQFSDLNSNLTSQNQSNKHTRESSNVVRNLSPVGVTLENSVLRKSPSNNKFGSVSGSAVKLSNFSKNFLSSFDFFSEKVDRGEPHFKKYYFKRKPELHIQSEQWSFD